MHRPETKIAKEVEILCNKVHENQCIGFTGEFHVVEPFFCVPLAPSVE
jgi:hypothetical protein